MIRHAFTAEEVQPVDHIWNENRINFNTDFIHISTGNGNGREGTNCTSEEEALGGGERDLHEMRVFKVAIRGKVVDNRDDDVPPDTGMRLEFGIWGFYPDFGSLRAGICLPVFVRHDWCR